MRKHSYLVLGSGMQGTAAGYFLARFGKSTEIVMADIHESRALEATAKINSLVGARLAKSMRLDASSSEQLKAAFSQVDGVFSSTSYELNLSITQAAIEAGVCLVDLGGNTPIVFEQLKLHEAALHKKITIVPDCGLAPGLSNILAAASITEYDETESVRIYCGGLPQNSRGPLQYKLVFSIKGLTNEYVGKAFILENAKVKEVDTLTGYEEVEFPLPVGRCEAVRTTGGSSTAPWTFQNRVKTYEYKTLRYPGHFEKIKLLLDLGFLDTEAIDINGHPVVPRDLFHQLVSPRIDFPEDRDLVVLRSVTEGTKKGRPVKITHDLFDTFDEKTGFSAMARTTAFPAALVLIFAVDRKLSSGVVLAEKVLPFAEYLERLKESGLQIQRSVP